MSIRAKVCGFLIASCFLTTVSKASAGSVYAISRHTDSTLQVYNIAEDVLEPQYTGQLPDNGTGAIDLAIDNNHKIIFSSYDGVNIIEAVSTKTMEPVATELISGKTENEIAGLEYCHTHNLLLAAERYDTCIRVLEFDAEQAAFTRNIEIPLPNITDGGIIGLCLDEREMRLYVSQSNNAEIVSYYDFNVQGDQISVSHIGDIPIRWNGQDKIAVGVAVYNDGSGTKYLYSSGYNHENPQDHPYLIRTSLDPNSIDPNTIATDRLGIEVDAYTYVAGVDTDDQTGYLYLTTVGAISSIRVYDPNQWTTDPNDCQYLQMITDPKITGPAGIVVGGNYLASGHFWIDKKQVAPDPNNCISPNTMVTYRTAFHQGQHEESNVVLKEILPEESIFVSADPNDGFYDPSTHTYSWDMGDLPALDPNAVSDPNFYGEVTVFVTDTAEPGGYVVNAAEVESDDAYAKAEVQTSICCWMPYAPIYVDSMAVGHSSGMSWANAYTDINDAFERAQKGCGSEIWVAEGIYSPGNSAADTFTVPDNVKLYGGFAGTETDPNQRNWADHKTILSGFIDSNSPYESLKNDTILTMGGNTLLDGFTIQDSEQKAIAGENADFTLRNCVLRDNDGKGIYAENGNLTVDWCEIKNSGLQGIYHDLVGNNTLQVLGSITNSKIYNNQLDGVYTKNSNLHIVNSLICQNGVGVNLFYPSTDVLISNNTIVSNDNEGVYFSGGNLPLILNCIIWNNGNGQLGGLTPSASAYNSCIQDCNDINGNISDDPNFAYGPLAYTEMNYHLAFNSPCVDAGDSDFVDDPNGFDFDGEPRIYGDAVDIGADEAVSCNGDLSEDDIFTPLDQNADGLINNAEFVPFTDAWLCHDPNDPTIVTDPNYYDDPNYIDPEMLLLWAASWNPACNLDKTGASEYEIDLADLEIFWNDYWLWIGCWKENEMGLY